MMSATSPYLFDDASSKNVRFIEESLIKHEYMFFIRKMSPDFPDLEINKYIYEYSLERDKELDMDKKMYFVLWYFSIIIAFISISIWYHNLSM